MCCFVWILGYGIKNQVSFLDDYPQNMVFFLVVFWVFTRVPGFCPRNSLEAAPCELDVSTGCYSYLIYGATKECFLVGFYIPKAKRLPKRTLLWLCLGIQIPSKKVFILLKTLQTIFLTFSEGSWIPRVI